MDLKEALLETAMPTRVTNLAMPPQRSSWANQTNWSGAQQERWYTHSTHRDFPMLVPKPLQPAINSGEWRKSKKTNKWRGTMVQPTLPPHKAHQPNKEHHQPNQAQHQPHKAHHQPNQAHRCPTSWSWA
jgi:hypothetical protein